VTAGLTTCAGFRKRPTSATCRDASCVEQFESLEELGFDPQETAPLLANGIVAVPRSPGPGAQPMVPGSKLPARPGDGPRPSGPAVTGERQRT
jgi:hypothetical protein